MTHISRTTSYPADPARLLPARDVAHLNHPLELEWVSRGGPPPAANKLPAMFFQVRQEGASGWGGGGGGRGHMCAVHGKGNRTDSVTHGVCCLERLWR